MITHPEDPQREGAGLTRHERRRALKRRIKTQCVLPCAETAAMLFWALLASGQITMRRVDGWQTLQRSPQIPG